MRLIIKLILITLILTSCTDNETLDFGSEIISDRNVYVAGYIVDESGNSTACYWLNGQRVELGPGQLEDIVVSDGKVYSVGWNYGGSASYWIDNESFDLGGNDAEAYSIAVHDGDVFTAGRDNGACYWKNTTKNKLSGGDSSAYGIAIKQNGDVFVGGYYMNNHHYVIPARWKNGNRSNLSVPSGGDGEIVDVKIYNGNPYYFGFNMAPNNMTGYVPKASYWKVNTRHDMPNGGGWQKGIYGGEGYGGFVDETGVYVAGKIDWMIETENGNDIPGTGGTYAHYWHDGTKFDLPGGVFNNMWVSTAYDVAVADGFVVVAGDVATEAQTQVPAIWVNDVLKKLEGDNIQGVAKAVFIN